MIFCKMNIHEFEKLKQRVLLLENFLKSKYNIEQLIYEPEESEESEGFYRTIRNPINQLDIET